MKTRRPIVLAHVSDLHAGGLRPQALVKSGHLPGEVCDVEWATIGNGLTIFKRRISRSHAG